MEGQGMPGVGQDSRGGPGWDGVGGFYKALKGLIRPLRNL